MFVIPGIVALLAYIYIRPQEVWEAVRVITFPMLLAFAAFGLVLDLSVGATKLRRPPLIVVLGVVFFVWALLTIGVNAPDVLTENLLILAAPLGVFLAASQGISTLRGFRTVTRAFLALTVLVGAIGIHQGLSPSVCLIDDGGSARMPKDEGDGTPRPCQTRADCTEGGVEGRDYLCEHLGLMGTTSIGGRVRYRGVFQDPNELAWALNLSLPFAFVWYERRRAGGRRALDLAAVGLVLVICIVCNILTRSRSGQISLLATLGVYFIRRFRWRGALAGAVLAIPVMLLGGRTDASAESSTEERLECWSEALTLWREHPFFGVGTRQFGQHHYLTAHNSALLTLAEMGPIGLLLFTAIIYLAFKIALTVQRDLADRPEAEAARAAAFATVASLVGMIASALFLSLAYHVSLWTMIGLAGAMQAIVLRHVPDWQLRWRWRDTWFVIGIDVALIAATAAYLRFKGV
jgi:hypothetical protein